MASIPTFTKTEYALLRLLSAGLHPTESASLPSLTEQEWAQTLTLGDRHEVLPLLKSALDGSPLPEPIQNALQLKTAKTVHESIRLQVLNARITALFREAGITAVTLKGCAVARFYPVPEYRKTTDIDLFIADSGDRKRAVRILCDNGFHISEAWHAHHHIVLASARNEEVELHGAWTEPFQNKHLNRYLNQVQAESLSYCFPVDLQGLSVFAYDIPRQAFYLLAHMLLHFVGSGFGLRNLCDWVALWENCGEENAREVFRKLARDSGTGEFAKAVTAVCVAYLGLSPEKSPIPQEENPERDLVDQLLRDILDAGEFGYGEAERMVGMDGNSPGAYLREFHHQMHLNFPRAGKMPVLWPPLWCATLIRFLHNNFRLKRPPISRILKKAGARGQLVSRLTSPEK